MNSIYENHQLLTESRCLGHVATLAPKSSSVMKHFSLRFQAAALRHHSFACTTFVACSTSRHTITQDTVPAPPFERHGVFHATARAVSARPARALWRVGRRARAARQRARAARQRARAARQRVKVEIHGSRAVEIRDLLK